MEDIKDSDLLTRIRAMEARLGQLNDYYDPDYSASTKEVENLEKYLAKLLVEAQNRGIL